MSAHKPYWLMKLALVAVLIGISPLFRTSQSSTKAQEGIGERLGQKLDVQLDRLGSELREGWASLQQSVDRMGVQARVYSRLRWDKQIATTDFEIDSADGGVVTLRGQVRTAAAKVKAVDLARDTVGVERVVDQLTVSNPGTSSEPVAGSRRTSD